MTAATIAMLHAQGDPVDVADEWSWENGADADLLPERSPESADAAPEEAVAVAARSDSVE